MEHLQVKAATVADNALLPMTAEEVEAELRRRLEARRPFRVAAQRRRGDPPGWRFELDLPFTRESRKEGRDGIHAEVGARLELLRRDEARGEKRYEVFGLGAAKVDPARPQQAMREALGLALDQLVASAELQLRALQKPTEQLRAELGAGDGRVRAFALEALVARRDPAALEPLVAQLDSEDLDELRRVLGQLVELSDPRAAAELIEVARGKDAAFLRELLFALSAIGGEEAEAYLFTVARGHDDPALRDAAERALAEVRRPKAQIAKEDAK